MSLAREKRLCTDRFRVAVLCCAILVMATSPAGAQSTKAGQHRQMLTFTTFPCEGMGMLFERILAEAYDSIGYAAEIKRVPAERALVMSNSGLVDGEAARVPVIEAANPDLIRVPTSIYTNTIVVYSKRRDIDMAEGWDAIRPHRVGCVLGYKFVNKKTEGMERTMVSCYEKLFAMLGGGRVDVVVAEYFDSLPNFKANKMADVQILLPPLAYNPMYHYLHRKHAALVPVIDAALRKMRDEGRMDAIRHEMLEEFENR